MASRKAPQTVEFDILLVDSFTKHQRLQKHLASYEVDTCGFRGEGEGRGSIAVRQKP